MEDLGLYVSLACMASAAAVGVSGKRLSVNIAEPWRGELPHWMLSPFGQVYYRILTIASSASFLIALWYSYEVFSWWTPVVSFIGCGILAAFLPFISSTPALAFLLYSTVAIGSAAWMIWQL